MCRGRVKAVIVLIELDSSRTRKSYITERIIYIILRGSLNKCLCLENEACDAKLLSNVSTSRALKEEGFANDKNKEGV